MSPTAIFEPAASAHQRSLVALVEQHLAKVREEIEQHHATVRDELVAQAASAESLVTEAIEHCLSFHHGEDCDADPNECVNVQVAIAAADAAAMMVASWLIATTTGTFTPYDEEAAYEAAFHLIAQATVPHLEAEVAALLEDDLEGI